MLDRGLLYRSVKLTAKQQLKSTLEYRETKYHRSKRLMSFKLKEKKKTAESTSTMLVEREIEKKNKKAQVGKKVEVGGKKM